MGDLVKAVPTYLIRDRSDYQLKHFVIGQHDTPEMRYRQIILEARDLLLRIKQTELQLKIDKKRAQKLEASRSEIKKIKAEKLRLTISYVEITLAAAREELDYLIELSRDYRHYTPDEIEANQEDYWELRLTRQATTDRMALEQGINVGNLESLMKAGLLQKELTQ